MGATDWHGWHDAYRDPGSGLSQRLRVIQRHIDGRLEATAPAAVSVISACAGDGRDLLEVLGRRPDAARVTATLVEADSGLAGRAANRAQDLGLRTVEVRCADAGRSDAYAGAAPADLILLCGVFGNISDGHVHRTIAAAPQLCRHGGHVIWTRHRREPDLTPRIRAWFSEYGFTEQHFDSPGPASWSVGMHRFTGRTQPLVRDRQLFTFNR